MAEKQLIDADEARRRIIAFATGLHSEVLPVDTVMMLLIQIPSMDAVEVVRCEVCKNAEPYDCTTYGTVHHLYKCKKDEGAIGYNKVVSSDDFCSYGERKDGDSNG